MDKSLVKMGTKVRVLANTCGAWKQDESDPAKPGDIIVLNGGFYQGQPTFDRKNGGVHYLKLDEIEPAESPERKPVPLPGPPETPGKTPMEFPLTTITPHEVALGMIRQGGELLSPLHLPVPLKGSAGTPIHLDYLSHLVGTYLFDWTQVQCLVLFGSAARVAKKPPVPPTPRSRWRSSQADDPIPGIWIPLQQEPNDVDLLVVLKDPKEGTIAPKRVTLPLWSYGCEGIVFPRGIDLHMMTASRLLSGLNTNDSFAASVLRDGVLLAGTEAVPHGNRLKCQWECRAAKWVYV